MLMTTGLGGHKSRDGGQVLLPLSTQVDRQGAMLRGVLSPGRGQRLTSDACHGRAGVRGPGAMHCLSSGAASRTFLHRGSQGPQSLKTRANQH